MRESRAHVFSAMFVGKVGTLLVLMQDLIRTRIHITFGRTPLVATLPNGGYSHVFYSNILVSCLAVLVRAIFKTPSAFIYLFVKHSGQVLCNIAISNSVALVNLFEVLLLLFLFPW